jgi:hypothetical protein
VAALLVLALALPVPMGWAAPEAPGDRMLAVGPFVPPPPPKITDIQWENPVQAAGYDYAYTQQTSRDNNGYATSDHVVKFPDGSINFLGYGQVGRVDYIWSNNDQYQMIDSFTFTLNPKSMNFHTFSQTAFMFNGTKNGNSYEGYAVVLDSSGVLGLYNGKFNLVANAGAYGTGGYAFPAGNRVATYATGISSGSTKTYTVKLAVDPKKGNRPFKIYINGELKTSANSQYGEAHGLGFATGYHSHSCSALTVINDSKRDITMDPSVLDESNYEKTTITAIFIKSGSNEPLAEPQTFMATAKYCTYSVINIPTELLDADGTSYKLISADPINITAKDSSGKWTYTAPFPDEDVTFTLVYDMINLTKNASLNGGDIDNGMADDPVLAYPGDVLHYAVQPSNAGAPLATSRAIALQPPDDGSVVFAQTWRQKQKRQGDSHGGRYYAYFVYQADIGGNVYTNTYEIRIPFSLEQGVYEDVTVPIGHYMGNCLSSGHNYNWNEDYGDRSMTVSLHQGTASGPVIWTGRFQGDTYTAIRGSTPGKNTNSSGKAPGMLVNQGDLNYASNAVNFGGFTMPADGQVVLVMSSSRERDYRRGSGGNYVMNYGFVVGAMSGRAITNISDALPSGLEYVAGSAKLTDPATSETSTNGVTVNGQTVFWVAPEVKAQDSKILSFDAKVTADGSVLANLANTAILRIALPTGMLKLPSNATYHLVPGPTAVTEYYVEQLNGTSIHDPETTRTLVKRGDSYRGPNGGPPPSDLNFKGLTGGAVDYNYVGYRWEDETEVRGGSPNVDDSALGFMNHQVTYVYKDARGYATVSEKYMLYDGAGNDTPVPGSKDGQSIFGFGETEYRLPLSKVGDIINAPAQGGPPDAYTYWGYSTDGGATIHLQSDTDTKYPQDPLFTGLSLGDSKTVIFYYVKNPKLKIKYMECDIDGGDAEPLPGKNDALIQSVYGDPLYFDESWKAPIGKYKYWGYQIGDNEKAQGAPVDTTLEPSLTQDYELTLYYADAKEVSVVFVEKGNIYNMLKPAVGITVNAGASVPGSQFLPYSANFEAGEDGAVKTYTYQGYNTDGSDAPTFGADPPTQGPINEDMEVRLFFSTNYTVTELWHENIPVIMEGESGQAPQTPTDISSDPPQTHTVLGGEPLKVFPPQLLSKFGRDWALAGYKLGSDNEALNPQVTSDPVSMGAIWADQTIIFAYDKGEERANFPVKLKIATRQLDQDGKLGDPVTATTGTQAAIDGGSGSVRAYGQDFSMAGRWYQGLPYRLTAAAVEGWAFAGWEKENGSYGELSAPKSPTAATFAPALADEDHLITEDGATWGAVLVATFQKGYRTDIDSQPNQSQQQDGGYVAINVVGRNGYPGQTSISDLTWFREALNGNTKTSMSKEDFDAAYANAHAEDKGVYPAQAWGGFEGDEAKRTAQLSTDQNGRYWFHIRYEGKDADNNVTFYDDVKCFDVKNIYTRFDIWQRDWNDSAGVDINPYRTVLAEEGKLPAFPYDLHGEEDRTVINNLSQSSYRSVTLSPSSEVPAGTWDITPPGGGTYTPPLTVALDGDFFGGFANYADDKDLPTGGHKYTFRYLQNNDIWKNIPAYFLSEDGTARVTVDGKTEDTITVNESGGSFKTAGGHYIPPEDSSHVAVGWIISETPPDSPPIAVAGYTPLNAFSELDANFAENYVALTTGEPPQDPLDPSTGPTAWFYVIYTENSGLGDGDVWRVTEQHRLYDPSRSEGDKYTDEPVAPDTYKLINNEAAYNGKALTGLSGLVSVGCDYKGGGRTRPDWDGYPDASQDGWIEINIESVTSNITVIYYYEASTSWKAGDPSTPGDLDKPTGIPDSDLVTVTARWREQPTQNPDGSMLSDGWRIKPPEVYHTRKNADFTVANDSTYPDPSGAHAGAGDPDHAIPMPLEGLPDLKWLFNNDAENTPARSWPGPLGPLVDDVGAVLSDMRSIFYYMRASDGVNKDHEQYVTIRYIDVDGPKPVQPMDGTEVHQAMYALLKTQSMTKTAPRYAGYMAVGTYVGDYSLADAGTQYTPMTPPEAVTLTIGETDSRGPGAIWSFLYHKGASFTAEVDGEHDKSTSKTLTLRFDGPVEGLTAANVTITPYAGAGALIKNGQHSSDFRVWTFDLENVTEDTAPAGDGSKNKVSVALSPTDELIFSGPCDLELKKGPALESADFVGGTKDRKDSSALVLKFSKPIMGMSSRDVSLTQLSAANIERLAPSDLIAGDGGYGEGPAGATFLGDPKGSDGGRTWTMTVTSKTAIDPMSGVYSQGWANVEAHPMGYTIDGQPLPAYARAEKRWLSYEANAADAYGSLPDDVSSAQWSQKAAGNEGGLARSGDVYKFYAWNANPDGTGNRYNEGELVQLRVSPGEDDTPKKTVLYAEWIAPPVAKLALPRVTTQAGVDGGEEPDMVLFSGRVTKTSHDFTATLEWRQAGVDDPWAPIFTDKLILDSDHPDDLSFWRFGTGDAYNYVIAPIPADTIIRSVQYEVRLTAKDANDSSYFSQDTVTFVINDKNDATSGYGTGEGEGGTDINGWIVNNTGDKVTVTVTLCKGDTALTPPAPILIENIPSEEPENRANFTFHNVPDGYYNIVVDNGDYRVTKGVYTKAGHAYDSLTGKELNDDNELVLTLGKTQSLVKINDPYAPRASVDDLPAFFDGSHPDIYNEDDKKVVELEGGTVEIRFSVSQYNGVGEDGYTTYNPVEVAYPPQDDQDAITLLASAAGVTVAEWLDFSLTKTVYDNKGLVTGSNALKDAGQPLLIAFELPPSCQAPRQVAVVYRAHDRAAETTAEAITSTPNADGELFAVKDGYLLLWARYFSTYAIATKPAPKFIMLPDGDAGAEGDGQGASSSGAIGATGAAMSHMAYINGYPDGTVRPDGLLTRAEAAMIFYRLNSGAGLSAAGQAGTGQSAAERVSPFPDVAANSWYGQAVAFLSSKGVLTGYPNGMFLPSGQVTRAELVALIERSHADPRAAEDPFSDLPTSHWARDYILSDAAKGWVEGYPDGTFRPDANITRAEAVKALNGWLDRRRFSPYLALRPTPYTDLTPSHWAWNDLLEASLTHEFKYGAEGTEVWNE